MSARTGIRRGAPAGKAQPDGLPLWCRGLLWAAARMLPPTRREDWQREWTAELTCFAAGGGGASPPRSALLRRALICFADARQIRRLSRPRSKGASLLAGGPRRPSLPSLRGVRHAGRALARNPVFSCAAIITLALGIGANTAFFSLVNAIALKPPAVHEHERLVRLYTSTPEGQQYGSSSYLELQEIARGTEVFDGVVGYALAVGAMTEDGRVEALLGEVVTGNYFRVLGVPMTLGRAFADDEDVSPGSNPVVVLGHGFWKRRFGADPGVVGSTIRLNGVLFDIIGVASSDYLGILPGLAAEFWVPAMMIGTLVPDAPEALTSRASRQFMAHARLRDGVGVSEAQGAVSLVAERLAEAFPESNAGHTMTAVMADSVRFHPRVDAAIVPVAMLMLCIPGLVLLIACTNLAGLLLARATDRRKEIAVCLALGAGRRHVVGQLLGESLLLSLLGGGLGIVLASWLLGLIVSLKPPLLVSLSLDVGIDHRVLGFTLAVSLLSGLLFGLIPALKTSKPDLSRALKDEQGVVWRARRVSLRDALIVGQVAVSTLLLLVAGLFVRSLQKAETLEPGFDTQGSVVFSMNVAMRYDEANGREYYRQAIEQMKRVPGATSVAIGDRLPLGLSQQTMQVITDESRRRDDASVETPGEPIDFARVTPDYLRTLGIDLLAGRDFGPQDRLGTAPVAMVSEAAAAHLWGDENPIGRQIETTGGRVLEVVGVARDTRGLLSDAPRPFIYIPFEQSYESVVELIVATDTDPAAFLATSQEALLQVDPEIMPIEVMTMADGTDVILLPVRAAAWAMGSFGILGLLLSAVGIVGALAYSVAQRGHEIGVRLALGATPRGLVGMVVAGGMRRQAIGMVIGLLLALAVGQVLQGLLVGISPADPVAFVAVGLLLAVVAGLASYIPARRAAAADPLVVLRKQ